MVAVALIAGVSGGIAGAAITSWLDDDPSPAPRDTPAPVERQPVAVEVSSAMIEAAARGRASTVRIESRQRGRSGFDVGSGVVIDDTGHIVTNAHVVAGADTVRVFLPDGSEQPAILLGHDAPFTDVAVLRIAPGLVPPLEAGDPAALQPGETVVVVGNPLSEFAGSVSAGIVSGINRARTIDGFLYTNLVQIDAALNSGNSGGALLNLAGQFVAMPSVVLREGPGGVPVAGIGFAIPADHVLDIAGQIIAAGGPIARSDLGIRSVEITAEVRRSANLADAATGVLVLDVAMGGPADEAGIRAGDIIVSLGGDELGPGFPLLNALARHSPGDTVTVVLDRNGSMVETQVRLGRRS
jgi:S1-C subfamily serine protease